jgi:hypothetical protein
MLFPLVGRLHRGDAFELLTPVFPLRSIPAYKQIEGDLANLGFRSGERLTGWKGGELVSATASALPIPIGRPDGTLLRRRGG